MSDKKKHIYIDYSATTPMYREVFKEMEPYFCDFYGNPSSIYSFSLESKMAIDKSRSKVAASINALREEIFFTSGGTESDNWAIKGAAFENRHKGNHIITSSIEHPAVLNVCKYLEEQGFEITYLPVDKYGIVSIEDIKKSIKNETIIISVMFANNEVGAIQPISEIGALCEQKGIIFHTDAVQAAGHIPIDVKAMHIDLMSLSAHKFYGPKGIGALYIRKGTKLHSLLHGGEQERARRAGTENIAGIVGLGKALELSTSKIDKEMKRLCVLRDRLIKGLLNIPNTRLNGPEGSKRMPGNINISFGDIEAETMLMALDMRGICASAGSACSAGSLEPSHVLMAMGMTKEQAKSSVRFSIGEQTTEENIEYVLNTIKEIVTNIRRS